MLWLGWMPASRSARTIRWRPDLARPPGALGSWQAMPGKAADVVKTGGHPMLRRSAARAKAFAKTRWPKGSAGRHQVAALVAREYAGQINRNPSTPSSSTTIRDSTQ